MTGELEEALNTLGAAGKLGHVTLAHGREGPHQWIGGHRAPGEPGYAMGAAYKPSEALLKALSPGYGKTWRDHLDQSSRPARPADVIEDLL